MSNVENPFALPVGRITHSRADIIRILELLNSRREAITANFSGGDIVFQSRLRHVDPTGASIVIERAEKETANSALLAQLRCVFFAAPEGWHIEFIATQPQEISYEGRPAIGLAFPEVLVNLYRRAHARAAVPSAMQFHCPADAGGVLSVRATIVDLSVGGAGLLVYSPQITLEPGTVLKGCRVELKGEPPIVVDLEVRYSESQFLQLPDGSRAKRSGCRFINPPMELRRIAERLAIDLM